MEDDAEDTNVSTNSTEQPKKYVRALTKFSKTSLLDPEAL